MTERLSALPRSEEFRRFLRFCLVGAANCGVDFAVYMGLQYLMPIYPARVVSWAAACLFSYFVNRCWAFKAKDAGAAPMFRFFAVNLVTVCLGLLLLYVFTALGAGPAAAFILSLPFTTAANYFGYRLWVFKHV